MNTSELVESMGIGPHLKGHAYTEFALDKMAKEQLPVVMGKVYEEVATKFNSKYTRVERAIRHAIDIAWCKQCDIHAVFKEKPTNTEFLHKLAKMMQQGRVVASNGRAS